MINNNQQNLTAGDIIFINRLAVHHFYFVSSDAKYILVQFKPHTSYSSKKIDIKYLQPFYHTNIFSFYIAYTYKESTAAFADCIMDIYRYSDETFPHDLMLQSLLLKLLYLFYDNDIFNNSDKELSEKEKAVRRIAKLEKYIESNYSSDISVNFACEFVNLDYHYFSRLFKQETGKTFVEYVNFTRILHAQQLLAQTDYPIMYIAQSVGFPNTTYFNRIFKTHCVLTPTQYRNNAKKASESSTEKQQNISKAP